MLDVVVGRRKVAEVLREWTALGEVQTATQLTDDQDATM